MKSNTELATRVLPFGGLIVAYSDSGPSNSSSSEMSLIWTSGSSMVATRKASDSEALLAGRDGGSTLVLGIRIAASELETEKRLYSPTSATTLMHEKRDHKTVNLIISQLKYVVPITGTYNKLTASTR